MSIEALLTLEVHSRDILSSLITQKVVFKIKIRQDLKTVRLQNPLYAIIIIFKAKIKTTDYITRENRLIS